MKVKTKEDYQQKIEKRKDVVRKDKKRKTRKQGRKRK